MLFVFFGIATLFAYNNAKSGKTEMESTATIDTEKAMSALPVSFYKRLEGTVAGKPVIVQLQKADGKSSGTYQYTGPWLTLSNYEANRTDTVNLLETNSYNYYFNKDAKQANLNLRWTGTGFNGTWISGDSAKPYQVKLEERYPAGSFKLKLETYSDSVAAVQNKANTPKAQISFTYLKPEATNAEAKWLDEKLQSLSGIKNLTSDRKTEFKKISSAYFKDYKKQVIEAKNGADTLSTSTVGGFHPLYRFKSIFNAYI